MSWFPFVGFGLVLSDMVYLADAVSAYPLGAHQEHHVQPIALFLAYEGDDGILIAEVTGDYTAYGWIRPVSSPAGLDDVIITAELLTQVVLARRHLPTDPEQPPGRQLQDCVGRRVGVHYYAHASVSSFSCAPASPPSV